MRGPEQPAEEREEELLPESDPASSREGLGDWEEEMFGDKGETPIDPDRPFNVL